MSGCGWRTCSDPRQRLTLEPLTVAHTARELTWLNLGNDRGVEEFTGSSVPAEQGTGSRKRGRTGPPSVGRFPSGDGPVQLDAAQGADP
jgi:hypothetical protein